MKHGDRCRETLDCCYTDGALLINSLPTISKSGLKEQKIMYELSFNTHLISINYAVGKVVHHLPQ